MKTRWQFLLVLPGLTVLLLISCGRKPAARSRSGRFPEQTWNRLCLTDAGLSTNPVVRFARYVGGSGCIVRHGCIVYEWGRKVNACMDIGSTFKPVVAHLVYKSIECDRIPDLDQRIIQLQPALAKLNPDMNYKDRAMTWRHLLTQTSCYGVRERPGQAFDYNDYQTALLLDTLVFRVHKTGYAYVDRDLLRPYLTDLIQCQDQPSLAGDEFTYSGRLRISVRDMARFGWLYLNNGIWQGRRIVEQRFIDMALNSPHPQDLPMSAKEPAAMLTDQRTIGATNAILQAHLNCYSFFWWLNKTTSDGSLLLPDAPADVFCATGHAGKQALIVFPDLEMVVCWMEGFQRKELLLFSADGRIVVNEAVRRLLEAVDIQYPTSNTEYPMANTRNKRELISDYKYATRHQQPQKTTTTL